MIIFSNVVNKKVMSKRPLAKDFPEYYKRYVDLVSGNSINEIISTYSEFINNKITQLPIAKADYAYAEKKWTIKEVIQHIIDAERIFVYRALRFARKDNTPLPGFDEDNYAVNSNATSREFDDLKREFVVLRSSSDLFFQSLNNEQLQLTGIANNLSITVNALVYISYGHLLHHINILEDRYL